MGGSRCRPSSQVLPAHAGWPQTRRRNGKDVGAVFHQPERVVVSGLQRRWQMSAASGTEPRIDSYLARVRVALQGLPEREIDDILRELRSHVDELAGTAGPGVEAALQSLGDPLDLAQRYRSQNQMVRAQCSGSPLIILLGLRHASRGTLGRVSATALYVLGYFGMG